MPGYLLVLIHSLLFTIRLIQVLSLVLPSLPIPFSVLRDTLGLGLSLLYAPWLDYSHCHTGRSALSVLPLPIRELISDLLRFSTSLSTAFTTGLYTRDSTFWNCGFFGISGLAGLFASLFNQPSFSYKLFDLF
jgi:hypothetical protein